MKWVKAADCTSTDPVEPCCEGLMCSPCLMASLSAENAELRKESERTEAAEQAMVDRFAEMEAELCEVEADLARERERREKLEAVALKIKRARDARWERVRKVQELAAEARRTGKSQSHRLHEVDSIGVWDLGDLVDELCAALAAEPEPSGGGE